MKSATFSEFTARIGFDAQLLRDNAYDEFKKHKHLLKAFISHRNVPEYLGVESRKFMIFSDLSNLTNFLYVQHIVDYRVCLQLLNENEAPLVE